MATPRWTRPDHLAPLAELIERSARAPIQAVVSVARQHGKTWLIVHGLAWRAIHEPYSVHAYITYAASRADEVADLIVQTLRACGVAPTGNRDRIQLPNGAVIYCAGIDGQLTGKGISGLAVVDDPHKNRAEANSAIYRNKVHAGFQSVVFSGLHVTGSILVVHTRWHVDDLIARLICERDADERPTYEVVNLPAILETGQPLWPEQKPLHYLERIRLGIGEYEWASLFMGAPRPMGSSVFRDVVFYEQRPPRLRIAIGVDLAVMAKTSADYHCAVVLAECDGKYYVLDVQHAQTDVPTFCKVLRALAAAYPGVHMWWDASSTERGTADLLLKELKIPVLTRLAVKDKFQRAQPVAAAWNAGKVHLLKDAPWVSSFVSEVCGFSGMNDRHDDQVDALGSAFNTLDATNILLDSPRASHTGFEEMPGAPTGRLRTRFSWG